MSPDDIAGYVACALVFATFCMSSMHALRATAVLSNIAFILYAWIADLTPVFMLHCALLPMNIKRFAELPDAAQCLSNMLSIPDKT